MATIDKFPYEQFYDVERELKTKLEEAAALASTLSKLSFEYELPFDSSKEVLKQLNNIQVDVEDTWKHSSDEEEWQSSKC